MAVLALIPIGIAAGAGVAGAAGLTAGSLAATVVSGLVSGVFMAAGSFIDSQFVFPALFGSAANSIQGPKLSDIKLTTGMPGTPINKFFGRQNRTSGCIIWISKVRQEEHDDTLGGKGGGNVISFQYFCDVAIAWGEGPINAVRRVWADGQMIWDNGQLDQRYDSMSHYLGTQDQGADSTIQLAEGIPNTPAFVGTAYSVINNLALHDWGNRMPNFTALVEAEEQALLGDVIQGIWSRAGRDIGEIDVSWVRDTEVNGYTISGAQSGAKIIEPLMMAYDMVAQEIDGVVHFYHRKDMTKISVSGSMLAAADNEAGNPDRAIRITDQASFDLPQEVNVTYTDANFFWQTNNQRVRKQNNPAPVTLSVDLPIVLDPNVARAVAQRLLYGAQAERFNLAFTLAPSQLQVLESDALLLSADNMIFTARVTSITRGNNFVYEVQATSEQTSILTQAALADIPVIDPQPGPTGFQTHNVVIMEIPIDINDTYERGYHYAVLPANNGDVWHGGRLLTSPNNTNFTEITTYRIPSLGGICQTTLPDGNQSTVTIWDNVTTLTVQMLNGGFVSASEAEVLNGANHLYVGKNDGTGEVIAFCGALLVGGNTYQLSKILRGRLNTEFDRMTGHGPNEYAILLDSNVKYQPASENIGKTIWYKAVPNNIQASAVTAISAMRTYRSVWPWTPCHITGTRDGSNNLTISWQRRSNKWFNQFDHDQVYLGDNAPQPFASEVFDIHIYDLSSNLKRTIIKNSGLSYIYTAAQQVADGLTAGVRVLVIVAQVNVNLEINSGEGIASPVTNI